MTPRIAILISGGGSNMVSLVKAMQAEGFALPALVISNIETAKGIERAQELGVATHVIPATKRAHMAAFEANLQATLTEHKIDLICLAGFMRILSADFTAKWEGKMLNIHPSLLPKYKGLDTHQRCLDAGDTEHGVSVHVVTADLDDGPVLGQARVPVLEGDTASTLAARVLEREHVLYPSVLKAYLRGETDPITL